MCFFLVLLFFLAKYLSNIIFFFLEGICILIEENTPEKTHKMKM